MIVFYEGIDGLSRISNLLELNVPHKRSVIIRQLIPDMNGSYRMMLMAAKRTGETNYIIDCSVDVLEDVLNQAQQVGMMTDNYNYIIANVDMHTIDLSPFQYAGTNITGVRKLFDNN